MIYCNFKNSILYTQDHCHNGIIDYENNIYYVNLFHSYNLMSEKLNDIYNFVMNNKTDTHFNVKFIFYTYTHSKNLDDVKNESLKFISGIPIANEIWKIFLSDKIKFFGFNIDDIKKIYNEKKIEKNKEKKYNRDYNDFLNKVFRKKQKIDIKINFIAYLSFFLKENKKFYPDNYTLTIEPPYYGNWQITPYEKEIKKQLIENSYFKSIVENIINQSKINSESIDYLKKLLSETKLSILI